MAAEIDAVGRRAKAQERQEESAQLGIRHLACLSDPNSVILA